MSGWKHWLSKVHNQGERIPQYCYMYISHMQAPYISQHRYSKIYGSSDTLASTMSIFNATYMYVGMVV